MDRFTAMIAFIQAADLGGFSAAAKALRTTQSTVSKRVASLEADLGGRLLDRSARSVALTERGRRYYDQALGIVRSVEQARDQFREAQVAVSGTIRIAASYAFGRSQVVPALPALLARHPGLNVELHLGDRSVDLVREGIDLAFRVAKIKDGDLIVRRIGSAARLAVAAPAYLSHHGSPKHPRDLLDHACIHFAGINAPRSWKFLRGRQSIVVPVKGRLAADSSDAIREAAVHGLGIALLPHWVLKADLEEGRLRTVLDGFQTPTLPVFAAMPPRARGVAAVRATIEHMSDRLQQTFSEPARS